MERVQRGITDIRMNALRSFPTKGVNGAGEREVCIGNEKYT